VSKPIKVYPGAAPPPAAGREEEGLGELSGLSLLFQLSPVSADKQLLPSSTKKCIYFKILLLF